MKILKYENNVSYLYVDGKYKKLLEISKEDILKSLEYIYEKEDTELEEYDKEKIVNEAERIVYENLYNKLNNFKENKSILKNEIDNLFKDLEEKYKIS
jgi:DNA polymerase III delta prime subunit